MSIAQQVQGLSNTYAQDVLSRKTRRVPLLGRKCSPTIIYTFLGFELKAGRKRVTCPDMSTARYLRIFAELGMSSIQTPYDPTQTSRFLPELERYLEKIKELLLEERLPREQHQLKLRRIYSLIRDKLKQAERKSGLV